MLPYRYAVGDVPEADTIRIHPIITKGGDSVNIVPADVRGDPRKGKTVPAILRPQEGTDASGGSPARRPGGHPHVARYLPNINNPICGSHRRNLVSLSAKMP